MNPMSKAKPYIGFILLFNQTIYYFIFLKSVLIFSLVILMKQFISKKTLQIVAHFQIYSLPLQANSNGGVR